MLLEADVLEVLIVQLVIWVVEVDELDETEQVPHLAFDETDEREYVDIEVEVDETITTTTDDVRVIDEVEQRITPLDTVDDEVEHTTLIKLETDTNEP